MKDEEIEIVTAITKLGTYDVTCYLPNEDME